MPNDEQMQRVMEVLKSGLSEEGRARSLRTWAEWLDRKAKGRPGWCSGWLVEVAEALEVCGEAQPETVIQQDDGSRAEDDDPPVEWPGKIPLDSEYGLLLGFTSDLFKGELLRKGNTIYMTYVELRHPSKSPFDRLKMRILEQGFTVKRPA